MNNKNERIVRLLKQAQAFYFATLDGDQPNVRPFNAVMEFEDKIYFYTNNHKSAFYQITENPKIELCASLAVDRWIRVRGCAVRDTRVEAKRAMLEANPSLRKMYSESDKIFEVFYLENMEAKIHSTYESPEVIC